ncbi:MAG: substrate-binding domain-containing protein [Anaerolineae bacterium]|nr:substrate-binding domain-containing protein [Anaerolineae bacterium]MCO5193818.1 substrate-binding domain-containing protein [Anaerolineae bacterium]
MAASKERITIQDIAEQSGVSISTVSRVLSGNAGVTEPKRQAVLAAVDKLDYRPNLFAQGLASGQSMSIGVMTQNFGSAFYDAILRGIIAGVEKSSYSPLFADGRWRTDIERRALQTLLNRRVDALILLGTQLDSDDLLDLKKQMPLVIVSRSVAGLEQNCLVVDNYKASFQATTHLLDRGHQHIAHITGALSESNVLRDGAQRLAGYQDALRKAGIEPSPKLVVEGSFRSQSGLLAIETLLTRGKPFSAIFAANDQMATGARLGLYRRGIRVPDDVSLIGFDDQPHSAYMTPPLTTVRQPAEEMGLMAAQAVLNQLQGKPFALPMVSAELIVRESVKHIY